MKKLLVAGSRHYTNALAIYSALLCAETIGYKTLVQGGCSGADEIAAGLAREMGWEVITYFADWQRHGLAAGPIRNQEMLDKEKPDFAIIFHDNFEKSKGSKDMARRLVNAGVTTVLMNGDTAAIINRSVPPRKDGTSHSYDVGSLDDMKGEDDA